MSYELSQEQKAHVLALTPEERLDHLLTTMTAEKGLWGLFGGNGWLLLQTEQDACLPVWPHPDYAVDWLKDEHPDCQPKEIPLDAWTERWLPGMKQDGNLILSFPAGDEEEGIVLTAEEFEQCLQEAD